MYKTASPLVVLAVTVAAMILLGACGGDDGDAGTANGGDTSTGATESGTDDATPDDDDGADEEAVADPPTDDGTPIDGSDIDWATVDLTSIDWANIDFSTVDFPATEENPTAGDLDDATLALIRERFANENPAGTGEATLTIGDESWTFDGFICAFGYENTESDVFSFSSNAFGTLDDGTRTQLQANIWDETGSNSLSGPDTDHEITFDDIDDFDDPAVKWLMTGTELTIDGTKISVDGATFRDLSTGEERQGSFSGDCGSGSRL